MAGTVAGLPRRASIIASRTGTAASPRRLRRAGSRRDASLRMRRRCTEVTSLVVGGRVGSLTAAKLSPLPRAGKPARDSHALLADWLAVPRGRHQRVRRVHGDLAVLPGEGGV